VVLEGAKLFPMNQLNTNGTLTLPAVSVLDPYREDPETRREAQPPHPSTV
jgi:hypothetical protein